MPRLLHVPQGSVLGPVEFIAYTEDIVELLNHHKVNHHLYADNQQMYLHVESGSGAAGLERLADFFSDLSDCCASQQLQLNASKTELIWFRSRSRIHPITDENRSIIIQSTVLKSVVVCNLGLEMSSGRSHRMYCANLSSHTFSRNATFVGLPQRQLARLRAVINASTRLVNGVSKYDHITPVISDGLHILKIDGSTLCPLVFKSLHNLAPQFNIHTTFI
jgi:Reverse transcriptase (RNA-dependent DNA polymerase)